MYLPLRASILGEFEDVLRVARYAVDLAGKAHSSGDDDYWGSVALAMHSAYMGIERIFEQIARTVDGGVPAGAEWHRELLYQMSTPLAGARPAIIAKQTHRQIDELRRFRHVVRYGYVMDLDYARVEALAARLPDAVAALQADLATFAHFLATYDPDVTPPEA